MTKFRYWHLLIIAGTFVLLTGVFAFLAKPGRMAEAARITVYKSPACTCCDKWANHLRDAGFQVITKNNSDMDGVKSSAGVQPMLQSCHTALVEGYVVEGHVPAADIKRLLLERPAVSGLTVPGMPMGSPGMEGRYQDPYAILTFDENGRIEVYSSY